jgi:hypothetical protein
MASSGPLSHSFAGHTQQTTSYNTTNPRQSRMQQASFQIILCIYIIQSYYQSIYKTRRFLC